MGRRSVMLVLMFASVLLSGAIRTCNAAEGSAIFRVPRVPAAVPGLLDTVVRAVNLHRVDALVPFTVSDPRESFGWAASTAHEWKADALAVPGEADRAPVYLAVFHTWHTCESDGDHVYRLIRSEAGNREEWRLGAEIPETDTLGFRVRDHSIDAKIDVDQKTATFHDNVTIERTAPAADAAGAANFALVRISDDYKVRNLHLAGSEADLPSQQAGGVIVFVPPSGSKFVLSMDYAGRLNHRNGDFIHDDEAMINSYWYPHVARLPATLTLTVTAPARWTALGQGEQTARTVDDNGVETSTWRNDVPVSYFTLDAGRYHITTRNWHGRLLAVYLMDDTDAADRLAKSSLDLLQDSMAFYEKAFGEFPYHRYAVVQTRGPLSGALEAYSFATFGTQTLPEYIPHELSHTWWGGSVPCTYTRSMWNEAFANYSDDLYRRAGVSQGADTIQSASAVNQRLEERKRDSKIYSGSTVAHASDTDDERQSAIGYGKGAQVLRVLEEEIGQETMIRAMRAFAADHKRGEAAEWPEFENAVQRVTGTELRWFFAQWLERLGNPQLSLRNVTTRVSGNEMVVVGRIVQDGPVYRMKLPIVVDLRSGAQASQIVDVTDAVTSFQIRVPGPPDRLRIDPEGIFPLSAASGNSPADAFTYTFR